MKQSLPNAVIEPVIAPDDGLVGELHEHALVVSRIKVPGGWVVVTSVFVVSEEMDEGHTTKYLSTSSVFVRDPEHKWVGEDVGEDS